MDAHQPSPAADDPLHAQPQGQAPPEPPPPAVDGAAEAALEELRALLARPDRQRSGAIEARVNALEHRTGDSAELIAAISPVLGDIIRRKIQDSREEMIEALYPIIGQLIGRAVAEAIRDLARTIDTRMRASLSLGDVLRRWRARMAGIPDAALALRDALPFRVTEIFLVHRESGLLLQHLANEPETADGADLVSGMLTAIRDFAQEAFGRGQEGHLDEIQYGVRRILIEASRHAYLAIVVEGIEPPGFREAMRQRIIAVENTYTQALVHYDGDATRFAASGQELNALLAQSLIDAPPEPKGLSTGQRRIMIGMAALLTLCLLAACVGSALALRNALERPAILIVVTATPGPTATATATPTATPAPTLTPAPAPTAAPTQTPAATATPAPTPAATATPANQPSPAPSPMARTIGQDWQVNIRSGPGLAYNVLEILPGDRELVVVGRNAAGDWWQVCCTQGGLRGWVSAEVVQVEGAALEAPVTAGD